MYDNEFMEQLLQGISVQEERRHPGKTEKCLPGSKNEAELAEMEYCLREVETLACPYETEFFEKPEWDRKFIYCHQSGKQAVCDETVYL